MCLKLFSSTIPVAMLFISLASALYAQSAADGKQTLPAVYVTPNTESHSGDNRVRALGGMLPETTIRHQPTQSTSVVERQEIERVDNGSTMDLLARIPGVSLNRSGGIAGTVFVRGLNSNDMRVPMFIDGDRFRGRNTLQFMLISPSEIERIEVLRGPSSSLYGSDGLTGLINIVTRRAARVDVEQPFGVTGGEVGLSYNSNSRAFHSDVALEMAGRGVDMRVYVSRRHAGDYRGGAGKIRNSDYETYSGGLVLGYSFDARQRMELSLRATTVDDGNAAALPTYPRLSSRRDPLKVRQARIAYSGEFDSGLFRKIDTSLYINEFDTTIHARNAAQKGKVVDTYNHVIGPVVVGGRFAGVIPLAQASATIGFDFMHERRPGSKSRNRTTTFDKEGHISGVTSTSYKKNGPNEYQSNIGAFASMDWTLAPRWTVSIAGRYDWIRSDVDLSPLPSNTLLPAFRQAQNQTETATTGSLGLTYRATDIVELVGSVGSSFRMPWSSEMFSAGYTGTSYTIPNPGLKPERGVNVEGGFRLLFNDANLEFTVFHSRFKDFLQLVTTSYNGLPATQRQNVGRARISGAETQWRWQISRQVNWFGNAAYLRGTNRTTGDPLISITPFSALNGLQYVTPNQVYAFTVEWQLAKGKTRINKKQEYKTGGYGVVNLYAEVQLDRLGLIKAGNSKLTFAVTNLFDKAYQSAATTSNPKYSFNRFNPLQEPGRSFNIALRSRF